jgi:hypothetical protein
MVNELIGIVKYAGTCAAALPSEFSSLVYYFVAQLGDKITVIVLYCYSVSFFARLGEKTIQEELNMAGKRKS